MAVKSSSKDSSAMQLAVANDDESSLATGRYKLRYDFYPANGKNTLTLVKFSDVNEAMATYTGGSSLMKDEIFSSREWYIAEIEVDLEKDKASLVISKKTDGTVVYTPNGHSYNFSDEASDYARTAIAELSGMGIVNGVGDNIFNPFGISTRAEAAVK